ncbi:hypothetical protein D7X33_11165 [Butyricicoccus sp. 1XD8-22]|nr:hypothetical protein D7X33_11165 [Butyricicoccus sp. 1XD8-22]
MRPCTALRAGSTAALNFIIVLYILPDFKHFFRSFLLPSAGGAKGLCPLESRPSSGSGRALPCTRNFFEKKLSKSFITPAGGTKAAPTYEREFLQVS